MNEDVIGQEVLRYEVFEPWCMNVNARMDGTPVFGALALHTQHAVLTLSSRLRFSTLAQAADMSCGLNVSVLPQESWSLKRSLWLTRSASCGTRPLGWYSYPTHAVQETPFLPVYTGWKITGLSIHPHGQDAVALAFDQRSTPVVFDYRADFDGGLSWTAARLIAPEIISPFLAEGEFAWLHPATKIEIHHARGSLKSAIFEDWPMTLRRSVFGQQLSSNGEPLRHSIQLLREPQLRLAYLEVVSELMQLRFAQHPRLASRLAAMTATVDSATDFGTMINEHSGRWLSSLEETAC